MIAPADAESGADMGAAQCGYCTPAMLLTAKALLDENPSPSLDEMREALAGVLCRCTGYVAIYNAVGSVCPLGDRCADDFDPRRPATRDDSVA